MKHEIRGRTDAFTIYISERTRKGWKTRTYPATEKTRKYFERNVELSKYFVELGAGLSIINFLMFEQFVANTPLTTLLEKNYINTLSAFTPPLNPLLATGIATVVTGLSIGIELHGLRINQEKERVVTTLIPPRYYRR